MLQNEQQQFIKRVQRSDLGNKQYEELQEQFENELKNLLEGRLEDHTRLQDVEELSSDQFLRMKSLKSSIQKREGIMRGYVKDPLNRDSLSFMATTATYTGY